MEGEELDWVSMETGEKVVWSGEPRLVSIVPALVTGTILIPLFGIGFVIMASAYLQVKNTEFLVTNRGLYRKTGVLSRSVQKIGFDKVQNISFSQGVLGNFFGYGDVEISTAGGGGIEMKFNSIEDPRSVQEMVTRQISARESRTDECQECGTDIHDDWLACPECGTRIRAVCDNCSNLLDPDWNYCPYCNQEQRDK